MGCSTDKVQLKIGNFCTFTVSITIPLTSRITAAEANQKETL